MDRDDSRTTKTEIGGTLYIVESLVSEQAKETAYTKVKRLILSNANDLAKLTDHAKVS